VVLHDGHEESSRRNRDVDWRTFNSVSYWEDNYRVLRSDDREIVQAVAGFFSDHFGKNPGTELLRGLDAGSGANLYPALGLLPWSGKITLTDLAPGNIAWLNRAAAGIGVENEEGGWVWQPSWAEYARFPGYRQLANPRQLLAVRHEVLRLNVLELPEADWDLGTMFFVAESMTSDQDEFRAASTAFLRALVPGAPFAAAFRGGAFEYQVAGVSFPAVGAVDAELIETVLSRFSADLEVIKIDIPARADYDGIVLALGTTAC